MAFSACAQAITGYVFDLSDTESTRFSSGTGGVDWHDVRKNWELEPDEDMQLLIAGWEAQAWANWGMDDLAISQLENVYSVQTIYCEDGEPALLALSLQVIETELPENCYSDYQYIQSALFDLKTGKQLQLSDLFYDGFNYIEYINHCVAYGNANSEVLDHQGIPERDDYIIRRAFTGFPADYPYFALLDSFMGQMYVELYIDWDNPFYLPYVLYAWPVRIVVPLLHTNSPYGRCTLDNYEYESIPLAGGEAYLHFPTTLHIDGGAFPQAEAHILEQLPATRDELLRLLGDREYSDNFSVMSDLMVWEHLLEVSFHLQDAIDGNNLWVNGFDFGCFDCGTGGYQGLEQHLALWQDDPDVAYYASSAVNTPLAERQLLPDYQPPEGTIVTCKETVYGYHFNYTFWLHLKEPSGAYVDMLLPLRAVDVYYPEEE